MPRDMFLQFTQLEKHPCNLPIAGCLAGHIRRPELKTMDGSAQNPLLSRGEIVERCTLYQCYEGECQDVLWFSPVVFPVLWTILSRNIAMRHQTLYATPSNILEQATSFSI